MPGDIRKGRDTAALMKSGVPRYICTKNHSSSEIIGMLGSMEVVVGMRLHSLIFATAGGSPVIGVSYDVKVDSFIKDMGSDACIPLGSLTAEKLCAMIDEAVKMGRVRGEATRERLKIAEKKNTQAARRLLGKEYV
jgi:polysaccharide pyruvyl transferase WcaK-like protein